MCWAQTVPVNGRQILEPWGIPPAALSTPWLTAPEMLSHYRRPIAPAINRVTASPILKSAALSTTYRGPVLAEHRTSHTTAQRSAHPRNSRHALASKHRTGPHPVAPPSRSESDWPLGASRATIPLPLRSQHGKGTWTSPNRLVTFGIVVMRLNGCTIYSASMTALSRMPWNTPT